MATIALIGCTKRKQDKPAPARELYQASPLFRKRLKYAELREPDDIFVLSAKHELVAMDDSLAPYDVTLKDMASSRVEEWASNVAGQLDQQARLTQDLFIILAGRDYYEHLLPHLSRYELPTEGMSIGPTLSFLNSKVEEELQS